MKHNLITLKTLSAALIAAAALAGCQREAIGPEASALDPAADEIVIPVSVEPTRYDDTKVSLDGSTGVCAWEDGDLVALYINGKNAYVSSGIVGSAVRLSIGSTDSRANYAIYPDVSAVASYVTSTTLRVKYPASYDMRNKSVNYCPAPMVADNSKDALTFYHLGAVCRLHLLNVPANTTSIVVTFTDMTNVVGNYTVTLNDPDITAARTNTLAEGGGNAVTFTKSTKFCTEVTDLYLNIPLPAQDYSSLSSISVSVSGGTSSTASVNVSGWGTLSRGQGKKVSVDFVSITRKSGYTGKFRGYEISPGILKWDNSLNGGNGGYTLTDGSDPLELLQYYGQSSSLGVYYHQYNDASSTDNKATLKYRLDGANNQSYQINTANNKITVDGLVWRIPQRAEWNAILTNTSNSTINNSTANYCAVRVYLDGAIIGGYDYSDKGLKQTNYQGGVLIVPDYVSISCPGITANAQDFLSYNNINWSTLKLLLDGGCAFLPAAGSYDAGGSEPNWYNGGDTSYYWTVDQFSTNTDVYVLLVKNGTIRSTTNDHLNKKTAVPIRLVRQ